MIIGDFNLDATEDINELEAAQQTFRALAQYCVAPIEAIGHRRKGRIQSALLEETWQDKAHRVIAECCKTSYLHSNQMPNGRLRKRHVPYAVPALAEDLIGCLKRNDEVQAKALFIRLAFSPDFAND